MQLIDFPRKISISALECKSNELSIFNYLIELTLDFLFIMIMMEKHGRSLSLFRVNSEFIELIELIEFIPRFI